MLIVLEGLDGSGKSTLAPLLQKYLNDDQGEILINKKTIIDSDEKVYKHLCDIKNLIWNSSTEFQEDPFTAEHWILLIAAWYEQLQRRVILPMLEKGLHIVIDGWHFRNQIKTKMRTKDKDVWIENLFSYVIQPDWVIFMDLDPKYCWVRRKGEFTPVEKGLWDGFSGESYTSFLEYQNELRKHFLQYLEQDNWLKLSIAGNDAPIDVFQKAIELLEFAGSDTRLMQIQH